MTDTTKGRIEPQVGFTRPDLIEAMKQAVNALYFDDSSDFKSSLWAVIRALNKPMADLLQSDPKAAFMCINDMDRRKEALVEKDPWVCLEGMTPSELDAYDYGVAGAIAGIDKILSGKDTGQGTANEPWESRRRKLIELVTSHTLGKPSWASHSWPQIVQDSSGNWYGVKGGWKMSITGSFKGEELNLLREDGTFLCRGVYNPNWRQSLEARPDLSKDDQPWL